MSAQESTPPLVFAEVTQPVPTPGTAVVLLSPTPAVETPAGGADSGPGLQWPGETASARESAAAPADADGLAVIDPFHDAANPAAETAPATWPAQGAVGEEACMAETSGVTSSIAIQMQSSGSAAAGEPGAEVAAAAARAHATLGAVNAGCSGDGSHKAALDHGAEQNQCTADEAAVSALLFAEELVPMAGADDPDAVLEASRGASAASASEPGPEVDDEPGADVLYSSAAAMIAAVADGIASRRRVPASVAAVDVTSVSKPVHDSIQMVRPAG